MPQYSHYYAPQGFFGMNYMWAQDGRAASPAPSTASFDSWTAELSASATVSPPLSEAARPLSSAEAKKTQYDKWTKQEEELLVQLWAEKHDQLECRENRKTLVWIAEKISTTLHSNKTADKCIRVFTLIGIFYFMVRVRFLRQRFCLWPISQAICLENSENNFIIVLQCD